MLHDIFKKRVVTHVGRTVWGGYALLFAVLFIRIINGVGQYWDWSFPYFSNQIGNLFNHASMSWTPAQSGSPLGYSSDYFVRWFLSLFRFLQPEWLLYLLLIVLFASGAYGVYIFVGHYLRKEVAFIFGLAAWINPAIFYKYTAGHLDYLISFVIFIYLINYLFYAFERNLRSAVTIGLMLALVGTQIQFLVIAPIFLVIFFIWNRHLIDWKYLIILMVIPLFIDLVWLSNFLQGAASVATTGANKKGFVGLSSTNYLSIFSFTFSKATLLGYFYNSVQSFVYILLFVCVTAMLVLMKHKRTNDVVLLSFMLVMIFLCTGSFQDINLGPISTFYPMFREVGHFAPLIVLSLVVLLGRLMRRNMLGWTTLGILLIGILITWGQFSKHPQAINYPSMRKALTEFATFSDNHQGPYRTLTYPFFDEYTITAFGTGNNSGIGLPLQNTGHDSFSAYTAGSFIYNAITPDQFKDSLQYKLLQTHDISVLQPYNIRYIYDMSGIYESNYNQYVPSSTYNNDLSLIKNDPHFLDELISANPGQIHRVSPHIAEITSFVPRISSTNTIYGISDVSTADEATNIFANKVLRTPLTYTITSQPTGYETGLERLFNAVGTTSSIDTSKKALTETVNLTSDRQSTLYTNTSQFDAFYQVTGNRLTIYSESAGTLYMNGQALQTTNNSMHVLLQANLRRGQEYYIAIDGTVTPVQTTGIPISLGPIQSKSTVKLMTGTSANLITNPTFAQGEWQKSVTDCNNYDNNPQIGMSLDTQDKSVGSQSLELTATRHDACTYTNFSLSSNTTYLLTYDYESPNATLASYYMAFNNSDSTPAHGFEAIDGPGWHHANEMITTPDGTSTGQLYVYALENDQQQQIVNRYDNFNLVRLQSLMTTTVPGDSGQYTIQPIPAGAQNFSFVDPNYTYQNIIRNGSFEQGPWRKNVADCANYDNNPQIGMSLDTQDKSVGSQSLELTATRHDACTYTSVNVRSGTSYLLSFDYQGNPAKQYGYDVNFNDPKASTQNDQLAINDTSWHTYTTEIQAPQDASTLTLYLYAFESDGSTQNIVHYDNVKLIALPDLSSRYYVVSSSPTTLKNPQGTHFTTINQTRRHITITNASQPFLLNLSETYNPKWRLELDTPSVEGTGSWRPDVKPIAITDQNHIKVDDYMNGWYVDPASLCSQQGNICRRAADGSYTFTLIAEFVPQRWFTVFLYTGIGTIMISGSYLWYQVKRHPSKKGVWRWHS